MKNDLRIGYFTAQPSSLDPFHGFDPDSYTAITACHDSLTCINEDGELVPGLAKSWRRIDPLTTEFTLREGVVFHNGEPLDAAAVVATITAQRDPKINSPTGLGILASIKKAEVVDQFSFRLHTEFPDDMLLWRLAMFSDIVPPKALAENGVSYFKDHPIGTGPFIFDSMEPGKYIRYVRNPNYWRGPAQIESFRFVIMPAPNWVEALIENKLDLVYGLHSVQLPLVENRRDILLKNRLVALSHWFLLASQGPLADVRVRLALNYAIDNYMLAKIQGHDSAIPQRAIGTSGQYGFNPDILVHPFDPDKARLLLAEAGYADGFTLHGIVADHSVSLVQMIGAYLEDIKVKLEYEVVPRTVWMDRVPNARMSGAGKYMGDFAVATVDNPIMYSGFHHYIFLFSQGPFALLDNRAYDERFLQAMSDIDGGEQKLKNLEQYVHDEALLLFTIQASVHVAARQGVDVKITKNGHFDNFSWLSLRDERESEEHPEWDYDFSETELPIPAHEFRKVLEATEYSSDLFYFPEHTLSDRRLEKIVTNLNYQQQVKQRQEKVRFQQIVQYLNRTRDMEGILDASRFSGIANYNANGEMVLCNPTFLDLFGDDIRKRPLCELFLNREHWQDFLAKLDSDGGIFGSMDLLRSDGSHLQAQTACTLRKGTAGENIGYLLIVRDESEERSLRHDLERSYRELEEKVVQRTSELRKTLDEVQRLKQMQDGDYFLTTLLLEPLSLNSVDSQNFSIETFTRQKKTFAFKAREYEIGGDLNIACTLQLRQKKYTLVLNGDAMGKSIQGAGGILVLGSLMRAIIERSRLSPIEREYYPERWLKNAINEIQLVFESFNGSMMVSAIIGLLDDETGCLYYVNAEHPAPVVFRDNCAAFIDQGTPVRKIGIPGVYAQTRVRIFRLLPNDVLFFGSDGKDDLLLESIDAIRKVNEDENLFVRAVEKSQGSLQKIIAQIERSGEIMDDLSLLRIAYHPQQIKAPANLSVARGKLLQALAESKNANDVERCRALCESHINAYPDDADAIARMGRFYKNGRNYAAAIDCFERLRLRGKASLKVLQLLVDLHAYSGNLARAAQILEECLEMDTQNTKTLQLERSLKRKQAAENNQTTAA